VVVAKDLLFHWKNTGTQIAALTLTGELTIYWVPPPG
jgi:hypothetical protein